jgi:serine/threonine protein kinase
MNSLIKVSRHPCIAQLVGLSVNSDGACLIIMEYMDGNLRKLINTRLRKRKGLLGPSNETRNGPIELYEEMLIISKIALGMAYLHSRGLVHRDLN